MIAYCSWFCGVLSVWGQQNKTSRFSYLFLEVARLEEMAEKETLFKRERLIPMFGKVTHILMYRDIRPNGCHPKKKIHCQNNLKLHSIEVVYKCFLLLNDESLLPNTD